MGNLFEEKVNRGTWRRCLADGPDTVLVADHEGLAFARTKTPSGTPTLLLSETDRGLHCEAFLDATAPRVQDLRSTSENAGLQMSVGFICSQDNWNEDRSRRELIQASVHKGDVTVCNYGANDAAAATITGRSEAGEAERRAHAETLRGSRERRMCPMLGYDLRGDSASRGRSQIVVPRPIRSNGVEWAKGRRAKLRSQRSVEEPAPFGPEWLITKPTDVGPAVRKVRAGHAAGAKEAEIKRYIAEMAAALNVTALVPPSWATESVGGQSQ